MSLILAMLLAIGLMATALAAGAVDRVAPAQKAERVQTDHRRHGSGKGKRPHRRRRAHAPRPAPGATGLPGATPEPASTAQEDPPDPAEEETGPAKDPEAEKAEQSGEGGTPTHLVWADEFNGPEGSAPDPTKWSFDVGGNGWGNKELQYYTARPGNASLDGQGDLAITARAERYRGADGVDRDYTSARLQTLEKVEFTYGRLEARIKVPPGKGLAPAFWTLGNEAYEGEDGRWPECGEIDAMEILGSEPNILNGTLHGPWPTAPHGIGNEFRSATPLTASFHTYGIDWGPDRISFLLDGSVYATVSREDLAPSDPWSFQHPNFLLLNLAVGGEWPGSPDASTPFPARMLVDWVRIYQ